MEKVIQRTGLDIPRERMFLMDASEKTNEINAYVTGFGASKRVVVWDTTIQKMTTDETLFVFGHEAGHYVLGHVRNGFLFFATLLLVALYLGYRGLHWALSRWGADWRLYGTEDWASLTVMLLLLQVMMFRLACRLPDGFSRMQEHAADVYGLEVIHGIVPNSEEVAAHAFQVLGEIDLADPNPPPLITFWLYSHPPLAERLVFAHSYDPWSKGEQPKYVKPTAELTRLGAGRHLSDARRRAKLATLCGCRRPPLNTTGAGGSASCRRRKAAAGIGACPQARAIRPSVRISAADRAIAASSQSDPPSRAMNSSFQAPSRWTSSSWPSVMRRISLIGSARSGGSGSLRTSALNASRRRSSQAGRAGKQGGGGRGSVWEERATRLRVPAKRFGLSQEGNELFPGKFVERSTGIGGSVSEIHR